MVSGAADSVQRERYHVLVQGELSAEWTGWFDGGVVEACVALSGFTAIDVRVPDQSALLALIHRLHALHLPLLLLVRMGA